MTAASSLRKRAGPELRNERAGDDAPLDPAIIALAELLGEQLAAEEIARRTMSPAPELVGRKASRYSASARRGGQGRDRG